MTRLETPAVENAVVRIAAGLLTALVASGCASKEPAASEPLNVVLICLDTVRADHLGSYGYTRPTTPVLDALAARSLVFARASSTAGWTKPSVPSFLTGTYPCQNGVFEGSAHDAAGAVTDLLPAQAVTLSEVFQQRGYRTGAFVHNSQLRAGNGFEQGFEDYEQANMDARELRWRGLDWIDRALEARASGDSRPFFLYLHFLDAHWPYPASEEWLTRFAPAAATERFRGRDSKTLYDEINDGKRALTEEDQAALVALYDGALAYIDSELGEFLAGLELRGLGANTIVCVVADHGEEFGEHGKLGHGHGLWENLLHVPWILHVPGRAPERREALVSLIDLFPTLLAAAGLAAPAGHEGVDRLADPDAKRPILAEHKDPDHYVQTLRVGDEKLVRAFGRPAADPLSLIVLPITIGSRWEAVFAAAGDELMALQLKPREKTTSESPELKGPIEGLSDTDFLIGGVRVHYDERTTRQTDVGTAGPELANGMVVKVRGKHEKGAFRAEKIKFYPAEESAQLELRANVEAIEASADSRRLTMGGFTLRVTLQTNLKDVELDTGPKLTRDQIASLLEAGASSLGGATDLELRRDLYDLVADPGERSARPAEHAALDAELDRLGTALARKRVFGAGDRKALDAAAVQELREIGYAGDEK